MISDITFGQYFPGTSLIHRADPRTKLVLTFWFIVMVFTAKTPGGYALCFALLGFIVIVSKISLRLVWKSIRPMLFFIALTAALNVFYTQGETILLAWRFIRVSAEGLTQAGYMLLRILFLLVGSSMLTYTTSPILLTDGIEYLLSPLKKVRFPVHEIAMMMSIALRFIPTLIEETDKIMSAQRARGADFESGNIFRRAKALVPMLVPLFVSAFRRAEELSTAMECRCYRGGEGRTRYRVMKAGPIDVWAVILFAVLQAAVILAGRFHI
jgi:energy-coupling factor transport system permease protein